MLLQRILSKSTPRRSSLCNLHIRWINSHRDPNTSPIAVLGSNVPWESESKNPSFKKQKSRRGNSMFDQHKTQISAEDESLEPSFYSEKVDKYAAHSLRPVTLDSLLYTCQPPLTEKVLLENAQYLGHERPVRYAKRVKLFQELPYIVNLNPYINRVYRIYYRNFEESCKFPMVKSLDEERDFIKMLEKHSNVLKDVMPLIARGFYECRSYFGTRERGLFLDQLIKMRIGLRLITSQHIAQYNQFLAAQQGRYNEETENQRFQGIVDNHLPLADTLRNCAHGVQAMCDLAFGRSPEFTLECVKNSIEFRYLPGHLEYMLVELLKNAFHATLRNTKEFDPLPPVQITVSQGNGHVAIRIRDRGGGIPQSIHARVFDYSFTTVKPQSDGGMEDEAVGDAACANPIAQSSPVSGLGFGLPMAKIYAEYFNGSVNLISMEGYGCDAFLELPSIEPDGAPGIQI